MTVMRAGKTIEVALPVSRQPDHLLRGYEGRYPSYFVCGPLVFSPAVSNATLALLPVQSRAGQPQQPALDAAVRPGAFPGEELVVVTSPLLRTRMTKGYADPFGQVLSERQRDQGQEPHSLRRADPVVQGRIPHVPVRRGLCGDPGLSPQGDARRDRTA